jgi:uncharacterized membrane protein YecN with MAPEG domain
MAWVQLVTMLALFEFLGFAMAVAGARERYGVKAPATTGNDQFERYFRVQQNTLEQLLLFLPSLWIAATYWNPLLVAAVGAVFLIGRLLYFRGYVREPRQRHIGFMLSIVPSATLALGATIGIVRALTGF